VFVSSAAAQDADKKFYIDLGVGRIILWESATVRAGGAQLPGANVLIDDSLTVGAEIGVFLRANWAMSMTLGLPPTTTITAAGTLKGAGAVGKLTYGPAAVTTHYHFNRGGWLRPYVGAGFTPLLVFKTEDGVLSDLKVENSFGPTLQVGTDVSIGKVAVYVDFKKSWLSTSASGTLGGVPVVSEIKLDPAVISAGFNFRF
jgi:outer membrane protein